MRKKCILFLAVWMLVLLTGCNISTVEDLYCLPKRSEEYANLQSEMEKAMTGMEHSAPVNGEHQQTVQMADLDGDGREEYLLFAKGSSTERPLRIFIFSGDGESYSLMDTIECNGSAFDQVDYVAMDDRGGMSLIVGRQVSDQVLRTLSVYRLFQGKMEQVLTTNYTRFLTIDLNQDDTGELFVIRPSELDTGTAIAEQYSMEAGELIRSREVVVSTPADSVKRIIPGKLNDGVPAVFVAGDVGGNAIMTDVYALIDGNLTNISASVDSGTSVQTLRNYYIYADDIDDDGVLELPSLITVKPTQENTGAEKQYIIRWYSLNSDGSSVVKQYTYHNLAGGWYLELKDELVPKMTVTQKGNSYEFALWNQEETEAERVMTLYILTGQKREEQAVSDNRFAVHRSETTIYAARLETSAALYGITRETVFSGFHLIVQDWNTGLT